MSAVSHTDVATRRTVSQVRPGPWRRLKVPIFAGPMRGLWWSPGSRGKVARILLGTYERAQTGRFLETIGPGSFLVDIGANAGYYTLLGARLVGATGRVVAYEPEPTNAFYLRQHIAWNHLHNVEDHESAVGASDGSVWFAPGSGTGTGKVSAHGDYQVAMCRMDTVFRSAERLPTHIKIDVEGAECGVLEGAAETIRRARPIIFLSTHGRHVRRTCCEWLASKNYVVSPVDSRSRYAAEVLCRPQESTANAAA